IRLEIELQGIAVSVHGEDVEADTDLRRIGGNAVIGAANEVRLEVRRGDFELLFGAVGLGVVVNALTRARPETALNGAVFGARAILPERSAPVSLDVEDRGRIARRPNHP